MTLLKRLFFVVLILGSYAFYLYQTMKHSEKDNSTLVPYMSYSFAALPRAG